MRNTPSIDRLPPHSIEAEQAVLGSILLDAQIALPIVASMITAEDFYDLRHTTVFEAMLELVGAQIPVNMVTLGERLKTANQLEAIGGNAYLAALPDSSPSAHGVEYFAAIMADKATERRIIQVCTAAVSRVFDGGGDTESLLAAAEKAVMGVRRTRRVKGEPIKELVHQAINLIERLHQNQGQIGGISTGFADLDKIHDGLHPDELIIISGFPGSGKTCLGVNILEHVAIDAQLPVGAFSFEMAPLQLTLRMIASRARINLRNVRDGFLAQRDFPKLTGAASKISNAPIFIEKASGMTVYELRARARQMKMEHGIKVWLVDYTQIVGESGNKDNNREREVANISLNLKQMAGEFGDPVLALSQLNDDGQLRESRAIGQNADSVLELVREKDAEENSEAVPVNLIVKKQRNGPCPRTVHLTFFTGFTRFESAAKVADVPTHQQSSMPYAD